MPSVMFATLFIVTCLLAYPSSAADCPEGILLAKKTFLDQDKRQARRLILEPGTVLKCTGKKGRKLIVQTPTGITGTISPNSVHVFAVNQFQLAYPITAFSAQSGNRRKWFYPGEYYPFKEDDNSNYILTIGDASYSVKDKKYVVVEYDFVLSEADKEKFNLVDYYIVQDTRYPEWRKIEDRAYEFKQQWGCGESVSQKLTANASVDAAISADAGLLNWIKAKFGFSASASGDIVISKEKKDESERHTVTYWNLVASNNAPLLTMAVERYHPCRRSSDEPINYKFHFPGNEFEEIIIDKKWATKYALKDGGSVPVRLSNIDDFFQFSKHLSDHYNITGDYADAIRDFVIFSAVNIR